MNLDQCTQQECCAYKSNLESGYGELAHLICLFLKWKWKKDYIISATRHSRLVALHKFRYQMTPVILASRNVGMMEEYFAKNSCC